MTPHHHREHGILTTKAQVATTLGLDGHRLFPHREAFGPCDLEGQRTLPGAGARSRSPLLSSVRGAGTASPLQTGGRVGNPEGSSLLGSSSLPSSSISGRGTSLALLWVSGSLSGATLSMSLKGVSVSTLQEMSLGTANILESVSEDAFSSARSAMLSTSGSLLSLGLKMAVIFGKHCSC